MTKKQIKLIARIWAGSMLRQLDGGGFNESMGLTHEEENGILKEVKRLGEKLLRDRPALATVEDIITFVTEY